MTYKPDRLSWLSHRSNVRNEKFVQKRIKLNQYRAANMVRVPMLTSENPAAMTTHETTPGRARPIWTMALPVAYLILAVVATIGWAWFLGRCALLLFGY